MAFTIFACEDCYLKPQLEYTKSLLSYYFAASAIFEFGETVSETQLLGFFHLSGAVVAAAAKLT